MPLYDYQCRACSHAFEDMAPVAGPDPVCPRCGGGVERLVSVGGGYREDADWIASVLDVVDKEDGAAHVRAFAAEPNRTTYRAWMRGEGLRPLEPGEGGRSGNGGMGLGREVLERFKVRKGLA